MIRVTIWNEYRHEKKSDTVRALYPDGIHGAVAEFLRADDVEITLATAQGLPDEVLDNTDVLFWWGHMAHKEVDDALVERIFRRVHNGMGMVFLHSGHHSKPFSRIVGSTGNLTWGRDQNCIVWNLCPTHPIATGIPAHFSLFEEMYSEPFYIPKPDDLVFISWIPGGEVFRSGCCWQRGNGRVFYFQPGHETYPIYHQPEIIKVIKNAVHWANPTYRAVIECPHVKKPLAE